MNQGFVIMNLEAGVLYSAVVCRAGSSPPENFSLSPMCGNCRICFRTMSCKSE